MNYQLVLLTIERWVEVEVEVETGVPVASYWNWMEHDYFHPCTLQSIFLCDISDLVSLQARMKMRM